MDGHVDGRGQETVGGSSTPRAGYAGRSKPGVAQATSHGSKHVVERRQRRHLLPEANGPQLLVARLLRRKIGGHRVARATAEGELRVELGEQRREVDEPLAREGLRRPTAVGACGELNRGRGLSIPRSVRHGRPRWARTDGEDAMAAE